MDYANIILEMLDRIKILEKEVDELKKKQIMDPKNEVMEKASYSDGWTMPVAGKRDTTRYMFGGNVYLKNRLVLAVIQKCISNNPSLTRSELKGLFDKSLQGSIGVVEDREKAESRYDYTVRFFTKPNEIIHLTDGDMYVCSQWGILNIVNFIKRAEQLGFKIEAII